jgi:hypothetical protein
LVTFIKQTKLLRLLETLTLGPDQAANQKLALNVLVPCISMSVDNSFWVFCVDLAASNLSPKGTMSSIEQMTKTRVLKPKTHKTQKLQKECTPQMNHLLEEAQCHGGGYNINLKLSTFCEEDLTPKENTNPFCRKLKLILQPQIFPKICLMQCHNVIGIQLPALLCGFGCKSKP